MRASIRFFSSVLALFFGLLIVTPPESLHAQVVYKQPPPGSIYKEFTRTMGGGSDWRVTDPQINLTTHPDAAQFLPNPELHLNVDDLDGAVRAEAIFTIWGGHIGTVGKAVRFNGNSWIDLPPLNESNGIPSGADGTMYMSEVMVGVDVPLSDLNTGDNWFQGTNNGEGYDPTRGWGQFGWYAIVLRVYYGPGKPHPTGSITSPSAGSSFGENPTISASVNGSADRVDFLAYYDGYDTDGDGIFQEYHSDYHITQNEQGNGNVVLHNYPGSAYSAPFQITWNTQWIADQAPGSIKMLARIRGTNGVWYVTDEVTNLSLNRNGYFVKFYRPTDVPSWYWVKQYYEDRSNTFTIPSSDNLSQATSAIFIVRSWNGINGEASPPNDAFTLHVNESPVQQFGNDHYYSFDVISIPTSALLSGLNRVKAYCNSVHHGVEFCWPGPTVMVRYNGSASNEGPTITTHPVAQTVAAGETATFTVAATGTPTLRYQWQKNGSDITSGGTSASYTTPPTVKGDSGAVFRCVVTNDVSSATSNGAILSVVTPDPPVVTVDPRDTTVQESQVAAFTVAATGSPVLQYQWQKNGSDITSGGSSPTYTTPATVRADSGSTFRCIVSNGTGKDTSRAALLRVVPMPPTAPHITVQPVSRTVRLGQTAVFSVTATGSSPLHYQWQKNGSDIAGTDTSVYITPAVALADSGAAFRCVVSNTVGHDTSLGAILSVSSGVENLVLNGGFESGTDNWTFYSNGSASFAADVAGPASAHAGHGMITVEGDNVQLFQAGIPLEQDTVYRLLFRAYSNTGHDMAVSVQKHGSPYTNYGLASQVFDLSTAWAKYSADFKASGFTGVATDARLMFGLASYDANGDEYFFDDVFLAPASQLVTPVITTHPAAQTVKEGQTASFSVVATGTSPLSYQWQKNGVDIGGATASSYATSALAMSDNGSTFRCAVTNLVGTTTSDAALLTVDPAEGVAGKLDMPHEYFLAQNHPNPFNPSTVIRFGLPQAGYVSLRVVNLLGQEVATLADGFMPAGQHAVTFHAERLPSGIYLYRMQAGNFISTKKLVLVK